MQEFGGAAMTSHVIWGDRTAWIMDPSGHVWTVATRIEETTEEDRQQRLARMLAGAANEPHADE